MVLDPSLMLAIDVFLCVDAHPQERSLPYYINFCVALVSYNILSVVVAACPSRRPHVSTAKILSQK
ncbi:hypothetical protein [Nostoc sp. CALU 1950]|uniref:hypothetical protein n=1 Tax=Nostoc sp. CALU 1950 TaxID=3104321 RepID=UPI003EBE483E